MASYNFLPTIATTNQTQTTAPSWQPQVGALTTAFGGAMDAYGSQRGMGPYMGDYVAAPNATQYGAYNQAGDFSRAFGNIPGQQITSGSPMIAQGYGGATNAMTGLYDFANSDMAGRNIATANRYAENPYISGAVEAATRDARSAAGKASGNLYRNAAGSNNINSDRAALIQGEIDSDLAENAQNISATMRNNAFNTGLGTALSQNQQGLGALSNAGSLGANIGGAGSAMMSQGINDQMNLSNLYATAGSGLNALDQSVLNNALAQYQGRIGDTWSPVQNLYNIAGANNWGSTSNTSGTTVSMNPVANPRSNPGALGLVGAGLGVAGSLAGLSMGGGATLGGSLLGAGLNNMFPSFGNFVNRGN